ncbi:hypothetical protein L3X16_00460 [Pseudomonas stutzeri]|nr:hypothetical protein [Stutzerimonas stutzeri]
MSFFGDLKTIVVASGKAVGNSVEVLASLTGELERKSAIMRWRARIKLIETKMQYPEADAVNEVKGTKQELLQACNEILALCGPNEEQDIRAKKRVLLLEAEQAELDAVLAEIESLEEKCAVWSFDLPIDEIRSKELLVNCYNRLIELSGKDVCADLESKKCQLGQQIELLQTKRRTKLCEYYPSGIKKSEVSQFDGKKDGLSEFWYENSVLKAQVNYISDVLNGVCKNWYPDGTLQAEYSYSAGNLSGTSSMFMSNGVEVFRLTSSGLSRRLLVTLWNGVKLGEFKSGKDILLNKIALGLRLFFNFKFIRSIYRAREAGPEHQLFKEYMELFDLFNKSDGNLFLGYSG